MTETKTEPKKSAKKMTRVQAMNMLVDYNIPFSPEESDAELVAKAKEIVPEPYYKVIIIDNGQTVLIPWAKVNGKPKAFVRGEEIYIRKRYLDILQEKATIINPGDTKAGSFKKAFRAAEVVQILETVPEEKVPVEER